MSDIPEQIMQRAREIIKDIDEFVVRTDLGMEMIAADIARAIMEAEERGAAREREECAQWHDTRAAELRGLGLFHAESLAVEHEKSAAEFRSRRSI